MIGVSRNADPFYRQVVALGLSNPICPLSSDRGRLSGYSSHRRGSDPLGKSRYGSVSLLIPLDCL